MKREELQRPERQERQGHERVLSLLLLAVGADIVAPAELKQQAIDALKLRNSASLAAIEVILSRTDREEEEDILKALILTHLTPSQMLKMFEVLCAGSEAIINYVAEHPEVREKVSDPKEFINRLGF